MFFYHQFTDRKLVLNLVQTTPAVGSLRQNGNGDVPPLKVPFLEQNQTKSRKNHEI